MTKIKKVENYYESHYEITVTKPRWFFFPEKVRTYVGSCTVWYCRETRERASTSQEERFSTLVALHKMGC